VQWKLIATFHAAQDLQREGLSDFTRPTHASAFVILVDAENLRRLDTWQRQAMEIATRKW
jgi:hypothetical protein